MDKDWTPDIYGDVPVAYAVYKLLFAKDGRTVRDTEYVFVNEIYCEMAGIKKEELFGEVFFLCLCKWRSDMDDVLHKGLPGGEGLS